MQFGAIVFDIDNVFFDGTYWHRQLHQMVSKWGQQKQFHAFRKLWQADFLPRVYSGELEYWDALASFFCSIGLSVSEARELLASSKSKLKIVQANLRPFSNVSETLALLRNSRQRLAVVSNSVHQSSELLKLLEQIGIKTKFDFCMTSRSACRVMPDKMALIRVASELGICRAETAYVSTNLDRLEIAAETGLVPILLSDTPTTLGERIPGTCGHTIRRFAELTSLCLSATQKKFAA